MNKLITGIIIILMLTVPPYCAYLAGKAVPVGEEFCRDVIGNDPLKIRK